MKTICILNGGPMRRISVNGKVIEFEMHPYCGPTILKRNGEPLTNKPAEFLYAASLWAQQGQKIDEKGLCIWHHEPKPIVRHLGGKNYEMIGEETPVKGE